MKSKIPANRNSILKNTLVCAAIGWMCWSTGNFCDAQSQAANPPGVSPDLQEVVTLSKNHMGDDVITNYISNTGKAYKLSADDIIYLNSQGVSKGVISALLETASSSGDNPVNPPVAALPANTNPPSSAAAASPVPPPLEENSSSPDAGSSPVATAPTSVPLRTEIPQTVPAPAPMAPAPATTEPAALQDNFFADTGLNPALWQTRSPVLTGLASMSGLQVLPALMFSPSGMQMSGIRGFGQFMGIQSTAGFAPPFTFNATVTGMAQSATPFEIYLVSADLRQWVSIAGHLGGLVRRERIVGLGGLVQVRLPRPPDAPEYGIWINSTGSGLPISALGYKFSDDPLAGVPYTVQVSAAADGNASVSLLDSRGGVLAAKNVPVGTGPFYVVLSGRDGPTFANWQSVQLTGPAAPVVAEQSAMPETPTIDYFRTQLAPYGNWVNVPGYGLCWQPVVNVGWRPYYDGGHWEYTDAGWYWASDYPWGDIAFHYGRWAYVNLADDPCWVWVPGFDYAPAWVVWRHADDDGYLGWAPLPAGAVFVDGGWVFNGAHVGVDFDFGLGVGFFTFVSCDHFWEHNYRLWVVPHDRVIVIFRHSRFEDHFRRDEHGRFINVGLDRQRMAVLTHHEIHAEAVHDLREHEEHRNALARREDIHSFRPGGRPNAMRKAEARPGAREEAERNHEMTREGNQPARGSAMDRGNQERPADKGFPGGPNNNSRDRANAVKYQKGQPQSGEKSAGNDSRNNKDRNGN